MRAPKLVQHMKANADRMSEGLVQKIRSADRCRSCYRECQSRTTNNAPWKSTETSRTGWRVKPTHVIEFRYSDLELISRIRVSRSATCSGLCVLHESISGSTCSRSVSWKSRLNSGAA